ncbi:hypothetical protein GWL_35630 [Herbaspirillum sp. GW103]|nr:hypothetical protein GWL_35630 [Herbaspirillum sp. GW103]
MRGACGRAIVTCPLRLSGQPRACRPALPRPGRSYHPAYPPSDVQFLQEKTQTGSATRAAAPGPGRARTRAATGRAPSRHGCPCHPPCRYGPCRGARTRAASAGRARACCARAGRGSRDRGRSGACP